MDAYRCTNQHAAVSHRRYCPLRAKAVLFFIALLALAPPAFAVDLVSCTGSETDTYSPGIRLTSQMTNVSFVNTFGANSCVAADGSGITSVFIPPGGYVAPRSCLEVLSYNPVGGSQTMYWNNGDSSVFSWNATDVQHENLIGSQIYTISARISSGRYEGRQMIAVVSLIKPNILACLTPAGVTAVSGPSTFVVL